MKDKSFILTKFMSFWFKEPKFRQTETAIKFAARLKKSASKDKSFILTKFRQTETAIKFAARLKRLACALRYTQSLPNHFIISILCSNYNPKTFVKYRNRRNLPYSAATEYWLFSCLWFAIIIKIHADTEKTRVHLLRIWICGEW